MVTPNAWRALAASDLRYLSAVWSLTPAARPPLDPNLLWWDVTSGRHFTPPGAFNPLPVLVQAQAGKPAASLAGYGLFDMPTVRDGLKSHGTGFVAPRDLEQLIRAAQRVQLGLAAVPSGVVQPGLRPAGGRAPPPLVGVIDDGCAFLNKCFAEDPEARASPLGSPSRVRWLWDQDRRPDPQGGASLWGSTLFGYGAELTKKGFGAAHAAMRAVNEAAGYRAIDYLIDGTGQPPRRSHGTYTTGLAAGAIPKLLTWCDDGDGGAASHSDIAFVSLPRATVADTSGRSLVVHLLNGIRYVLSKAKRGQAVVVNLSLGTHGGPHDGSSPLESAIAELVTGEWSRGVAGHRLTIVTGAGNGFEADMHAHLPAGQTLDKDESAKFVWELPAADRTDSFLEVWSTGELAIEVIDPTGVTTGWLAPGTGALLHRDGQVVASLTNLTVAAIGQGQLLHLATAPTQVCDGGPAAPAGYWQVSLRNDGKLPCGFDAWIDRDDAPFGAVTGPRAPSRLLNGAIGPRVVSGERTMNALADPNHALVAAASVLLTAEPSSYSASGGGRGGSMLRRPLLAMPADESPALQGLPVPGVITGAIDRLTGTSASSALLAREAVDVLGANSSLSTLDALKVKLVEQLVIRQPIKGPIDLRVGAGAAGSGLCRLPTSAQVASAGARPAPRPRPRSRPARGP